MYSWHNHNTINLCVKRSFAGSENKSEVVVDRGSEWCRIGLDRDTVNALKMVNFLNENGTPALVALGLQRLLMRYMIGGEYGGMDVEDSREGDGIINTRLLSYDIRVSRAIMYSLRGCGYSDLTTLNVVVTNLLACIGKNNKLVYSRNTSIKSSGRKGLTARRVIRCVEFMVEAGWVSNHTGVSHINREKRVVSFIAPTKVFIGLWNVEKDMKESEDSYQDSIQVIELRDTSKKSIEYKKTQDVKEMERVIREMNRVNESCEIRNAEGSLLTNIYCRIFNESFNYGGRFYKADILTIKNRDTSARLDITIDGKEVVEVDYSNLHFRLTAALEGICSDHLPLDVYSGMLEDESNKVDRRIVKIAVNMMFNCHNDDQAERAIRKEINTLSAEDKATYTLGSAKAVMLLIYDSYPEFEDFFCDEASYGRSLQNADSHLANDILCAMIGKGIPCLPVHDSFIVQREHEGLLTKLMGDCFRNRFSVDTLVPISISWKENGEVFEEKVLV